MGYFEKIVAELPEKEELIVAADPGDYGLWSISIHVSNRGPNGPEIRRPTKKEFDENREKILAAVRDLCPE